MSDDPVFYLLKPEWLEPATSVNLWLGRIVEHYAAPDAGFTPENPARLITIPPSETTLTNVKRKFEDATNSTLGAKLTGVASAVFSKDKSSRMSFETSSIRCIRLVNHAKYFAALRNDPEVKQDLTAMLRPGGKPAYLIVGLLVWTDVTFTNTKTASNTVGGQFVLPATGAIPGTLLPNVAPGANQGVGVAKGKALEASSEGSHIFAIQYRTVRRRAFSGFTNSEPKLGGGPRYERDRVFAPEEGPQREPADLPVKFEMDEEDVLWVDTIESGLNVEDLDDISFAFDD